MSKKRSFLSIFTEYLHDVYVLKNCDAIDNHFQGNMIHRGEFGLTLAAGGMKAHALGWLQLFNIIDVSVDMKTNNAGLITCEYFEKAQQLSTFKSLEPSKNKTVTIRNHVSIVHENENIIHYCLSKDFNDLSRQLVDYDESKYKNISENPIFEKQHAMHINVIIGYLKSKNIHITTLQAEYLCGYFMGAADNESRRIIGLPGTEAEKYKEDIQSFFDTGDQMEILSKLRKCSLAPFFMEAYNLLRQTTQSALDTSIASFERPMYLTDNSKYLL